MHPRDMMLLNEDEAGKLSSVDFEFALEWYRRGVMAEREASAKTCEALWQEEATAAANGNQNPRYHDCIECAHAIRERSNVQDHRMDASNACGQSGGSPGSA